jgi:hypothetical protein
VLLFPTNQKSRVFQLVFYNDKTTHNNLATAEGKRSSVITTAVKNHQEQNYIGSCIIATTIMMMMMTDGTCTSDVDAIMDDDFLMEDDCSNGTIPTPPGSPPPSFQSVWKGATATTTTTTATTTATTIMEDIKMISELSSVYTERMLQRLATPTLVASGEVVSSVENATTTTTAAAASTDIPLLRPFPSFHKDALFPVAVTSAAHSTAPPPSSSPWYSSLNHVDRGWIAGLVNNDYDHDYDGSTKETKKNMASSSSSSSSEQSMNGKMKAFLLSNGLLSDTNKYPPEGTTRTTTTSSTTPLKPSLSTLNDDENDPPHHHHHHANEKGEAASSSSSSSQSDFLRQAKRVGVGIVGGTITTVGLIMIPLPTPFGVVVAGAGMAVLGTEFPAATQLLETSRDKLVHAIETHVVMENDDREDDDNDDDDDDGCLASDDNVNVNNATRSTTTPAPIMKDIPWKNSLSNNNSSTANLEVANDNESKKNDQDAAEEEKESPKDGPHSPPASPLWLTASNNNNNDNNNNNNTTNTNWHPEQEPNELETAIHSTWKILRKQSSRVGRHILPVLKSIGAPTTITASTPEKNNNNADFDENKLNSNATNIQNKNQLWYIDSAK